jgi:hypothetical protein
MERSIDFSKFRQLLAAIENSEVLIRIRCSGERWCEFSSLLLLSENAMILQENSRRRIIMNLKNVVEFEIDQAALDLDPNAQYLVAQ